MEFWLVLIVLTVLVIGGVWGSIILTGLFMVGGDVQYLLICLQSPLKVPLFFLEFSHPQEQRKVFGFALQDLFHLGDSEVLLPRF